MLVLMFPRSSCSLPNTQGRAPKYMHVCVQTITNLSRNSCPTTCTAINPHLRTLTPCSPPHHRHQWGFVCPSFVHAGVQAICAGGDHSLVLKQDGSVWGTGSNRWGQLGDGTEGIDNHKTSFEMLVPSGQRDTMV